MASVIGAYARAFADVVLRGKLDPAGMIEQLRGADALLAESAALRRVLENPSIPSEGKLGVLDGIAQKTGMARPTRNFLAVLTDHRRLPLLGDITREVEQELNNRLGIADAEVRSARDLNDSEKKLLEAEITKLTGKRVRARFQRDAALLGGAVVQVGSTIYDGSVAGQLERIREELVEG